MAKQQSEAKKETVGRVMHEFKHGELESAGRKVRNPKQAIAIGLSEAGASRNASPKQNRRRQARTQQRERTGGEAGGTTKSELYAEAKRRGVTGRSRMSKDELQKAVAARK